MGGINRLLITKGSTTISILVKGRIREERAKKQNTTIEEGTRKLVTKKFVWPSFNARGLNE